MQCGHTARGYQCVLPQSSQWRSMKRPSFAAAMKASLSGPMPGDGMHAGLGAFIVLTPVRRINVELRVPAAQVAAGALREREAAVLHLHRRMRLAAQLAHRLDHLGDAAAVGRVVVAQAAAIGVERQLAAARDQVAVGDEAAALALLAEAEVLDLQQHGDREAVVDRRVLDVARLHAGFGERRRARHRRTGGGEVDVAGALRHAPSRRRRSP